MIRVIGRDIAGTMKHYTPTFAMVTVVGLSGCPVTQVNRLPESSPLTHATAITVVGDFKHNPSGYLFPIQVGAFQRVDLLQYDTGGLDISAGYNDALPECLVALTIYIYPTPRMTFIGADPDVVRSLQERWLEGAYTHAREEIIRAHPDAVLESEDARTQDGVPGKKTVYSIGEAKSELYVFVIHHSWFLKYRATYPSQCSAQARQTLSAFHTAWTGRAS
jgi:hypothetical protein